MGLMIQEGANKLFTKNHKLSCFTVVLMLFLSAFVGVTTASYEYDEDIDNSIDTTPKSDDSDTNYCECSNSNQQEDANHIQTYMSFEELRQSQNTENWAFTVSENSEISSRSIETLCGLKPPENLDEYDSFISDNFLNSFDEDLPGAFDWRDQGLPPAKNQGQCGSCWAFGTLSPLECNIWITDGDPVDLSEQWIVSCNKEGWGCNGGYWAHDYLKENGKTGKKGGNGAVLEENFPYTATNGNCKEGLDHEYFIEDWAMLSDFESEASVDDMKQAIKNYGPISAAVHVGSEFAYYSGGVFNKDKRNSCNHAVTLVGWNDSYIYNGEEYGVWILRNSWGTSWGVEGGYMYIEYGCSEVGTAATYVVYKGGVSSIEYTPESHDFGKMDKGASDTTSFEISSSNSDVISFSLSSQVDWLSVSPSSGSCSAEDPAHVTVGIDTSSLSDGMHSGSITIDGGDSGSGIFEVSVKVGTFPSFDPIYGEIVLEEGEEKSTSFEIWNGGVGTLDYWLKKDSGFDWVHFSPTEGKSSGEHNTIEIDVNSTGISDGHYICNLTVNTNSEPPEGYVIKTAEVSKITSNSATLHGQLMQSGWDIWFRYKKADSNEDWTNFDNGYAGRYWGKTPYDFSMNTGNNLLSNTTYVYQACADNNKIGLGLEIKYGINQTFKTADESSSVVDTVGVKEGSITGNSAVLQGVLNEDDWDVWFRYRKNVAGEAWINFDNGNGLKVGACSFEMDVLSCGERLDPNWEYEFQAMADNNKVGSNLRVENGSSMFFTTADPIVITVGVDSITSNSANLKGFLNDDEAWDVWFRYREKGSGTWIPLDNGNNKKENVDDFEMNTGSNLDPNTEYEFQAMADNNRIGNNLVIENGTTMNFTTQTSVILNSYGDSHDGNYVYELHIYVGITPDPILDFSPESHDFGEVSGGCGRNVETTFNITNLGDGILEYNLVAPPSWLSIDPDSGSLSKGEINSIKVTANLCGLNSGESYHGDVEISSNGGNDVFGVDLKIAGGSNGPDLSFYPKSHDFGYMEEGKETSTTFEIWNGGSDTLTYELSESVNWITSVSPTSGESSGDRETITVRIDTSGLSSGESYQGKIDISSNGGDDKFDIFVNIVENFPPVFKNENPVDGAMAVSLDINKLEIDISDPESDKFSWSIETHPDIGSKSGTGASGGKKSCSVNGLEPGTSYVWTVIATDVGSGLEIREEYSFLTKQNLPPVPKNPSPSNGEKDAGINCVLSWECTSDDTLSYDVYFGENNNPSIVANKITKNSYEPEGQLKTDTYYFWKIVAWNDLGKSTSSTIWNFKTKKTDAPSNPKNPLPINNSHNVGINCVLSWACDDPAETLSYDVYLGRDSNPPLVKEDINIKSYNSKDDLEYNAEYYWRIVVWNNDGKSTKGPLWRFTTIKNTPINPTPKDKAINVSIGTFLSWECKANSYDIYFGRNNNLETPVATNITGNSYDPDTLNLNATYYWKVVACFSDTISTSSDVWSFTTGVSQPPENGDIEINVRRLCLAGVKAKIENTGNNTFSNVTWSISVNGGVFNRINVSKEGCIETLGSGEKKEISTWDFFDFITSRNTSDFKSRILRGFGRIDVVIELNADGKTNIECLDGFVFGRIVWLPFWLRSD